MIITLSGLSMMFIIKTWFQQKILLLTTNIYLKKLHVRWFQPFSKFKIPQIWKIWRNFVCRFLSPFCFHLTKNNSIKYTFHDNSAKIIAFTINVIVAHLNPTIICWLPWKWYALHVQMSQSLQSNFYHQNMTCFASQSTSDTLYFTLIAHENETFSLEKSSGTSSNVTKSLNVTGGAGDHCYLMAA